MNVIDLIVALCCIFAVFRGLAKGFVVQAASLLALVLGAWLSFKFSGPLAGWLKPFTDLSGAALQAIAFALILVIVTIVLNLAGKALEKVVKFVMLGWLDKLLGIAFALLKTLLVIGLAILLLEAACTKIPLVPAETLGKSILYRPIKEIADIVFPYLKELILHK